MPYTTEGFVILVREKKELVAVIASRATNETATQIEIFCKRAPQAKVSVGRITSANSFAPVDGIVTSSAFSLFMNGAIFTSRSDFTNITTAYSTNVLKAQPLASTNWTVSPAGNGMALIPKRTGAESATFLVRSNMNELTLIHCFRSAASTQTHVLVGCANR